VNTPLFDVILFELNELVDIFCTNILFIVLLFTINDVVVTFEIIALFDVIIINVPDDTNIVPAVTLFDKMPPPLIKSDPTLNVVNTPLLDVILFEFNEFDEILLVTNKLLIVVLFKMLTPLALKSPVFK
jgi:hypothetical protein